MEDTIKCLEKTKNAFGITSWTFEYYGIKTVMIEVGWIKHRKVFVVEVLMSMPDGMYSQILEVSAELLKGYESLALKIAAEKCLKSYENEIKGK